MAQIKKKGFNMIGTEDYQSLNQNEMEEYVSTDFSKIRVGIKTVSDAIFKLGDFQKVNPSLAKREQVLRAIHYGNFEKMRNISNYFYKVSGIYQRLCRYLAYMYRYDWLITPHYSKSMKPDKLLEGFYKILTYLDNFQAKKFFGDVALKVVKNGCYYGYLIAKQNRIIVQELPPRYCRVRFTVNGQPAVEFNMKYFDDMFTDVQQKMKMLKVFPPEFEKGYKLYRQNKLKPDFPGDDSGWYLLEIGSVIKFNLNGEDFPPLIAVIPAIIDLDEAQDLDRKKMQQQLLKIIIQKLPIDKNGDLVFDVDEAQQLHNNAVQMLSKAIGIDVLTTFADVEVANTSDNRTTTTKDDLEKVERAVYNEAGISQMQFNTDGNIALEKSILNDEASMWNLIQQFETFLNTLLIPYNKNPKKVTYRAQILPTTIYNYKDLAKQYKEHTQLGYSKMLPQIALGQSQSSILATAYFENDILDLVNVFIPPLMSSTMNADVLNRNKEAQGSESGAGRPEKEDDEKSTKTIQNRQSMN